VAIVYCFSNIASYTLEPRSVSHIWWGSGVSFAATFIYGYKILPGLAISSVFSSLFYNTPLSIALLFFVKLCIESVIGSILLKRGRFCAKFEHVNEVWKFIFAATVATVLSNLLVFIPYPRFHTFFKYWQGDLLGILIVFPLLLTWKNFRPKGIVLDKYLEHIFWFTGLVGVSWVAFCSRTRTVYFPYPLAHLALIFLGIAALRFGQRWLAVGNFLVSLFVFWGLSREAGPFVTPLGTSFFFAQMFVLGCSIATMLASAYFAQKTQNQTTFSQENRIEENISFFKSQFFASASLGLQEPFHLISVNTKSLIKKSAKYPDIQNEAYELALAGEQMLAFSTQLMDMAKIESGSVTLCFETIFAQEITEKIVKIITPLVDKNHNELNCNVVNFSFCTDREKLLQILLNLLTNAASTTTNGSISLSIETPEEEYVVFVVSNLRGGVAIEDIKQIFGTFSLSGLELIMSQKLAKMLGGSLVVNILDVGVSFRLTLPFRQNCV
jgi:signal transduction histidine kinase